MWLGGRCAVVWGRRRKRSLVGGFRSVNGCPPNLLTRQNKNQPEREFLENGENPEIRKIRNNKQKCTKPEFLKGPAKCGKTKSKVRKKQNRKQNPSRKSLVKRHITRWPFKWATNAGGGNQQAEQNNSWLCGMGGIWRHACGRQRAPPSAWRAWRA